MASVDSRPGSLSSDGGVHLDCSGMFWKRKTCSVTIVDSLRTKIPEKKFKLCPHLAKGSDIYRLCNELEAPGGQCGEKDSKEDPLEKVYMSEDTLAA